MAIIKVKSVKDIPRLKEFKVESINILYIEMAYKIWQIILRSIFKYLGDYSLYEVLNHFRLIDFNRGALGCGIISVTESLEEFYLSLQKSLKVDDNTTLLDIDMVLRRINNGY